MSQDLTPDFIGSICRAINSIEGSEKVYDIKRDEKDVKNLRLLLAAVGEDLHITGTPLKGTPLKVLNKQLKKAGWEQSKFVSNEGHVYLIDT